MNIGSPVREHSKKIYYPEYALKERSKYVVYHFQGELSRTVGMFPQKQSYK